MKKRKKLKTYLVMSVFLLVLAVPTLAGGAVFIVNSMLDKVDLTPGDGIVDTGTSGEVTLRAAIMEANALAGADEIQLPASTYTLSIAGTGEDAAATGDLDITDNLTITGGGADITTIDAAGLDRVFEVFAGVTVFENVTISGGNLAGFNFGGGIRNFGTLTIVNSVISANSVDRGGGVYSAGMLTITNSTFASNSANDAAAIFVDSGTTATISNSAISGNSANNAGGIHNNGTMTISNSTISGNTANYEGGGIRNFGLGTLTITNSTISGNTANVLDGGGIVIGSQGTMTITNSTISGNSANRFAGGISSASNSVTLTLINSTITGNTANSDGGGIRIPGGTFNVKNTIIAGNGTTGANPDVVGSFTSLGNNLIGDVGSASGFTNGVNGDKVGTGGSPIDPLLGPLQDNGGPTFTHALLPGSPAIDAGNNTGAPPTDQRGEPRIATVDIGAYESMAEPENTQPGDDVQVSDPETGTTISFDTVEESGETTVNQTSIGEGPPPPTGLKIVPLGVYYEINTTAVFSDLLHIAIEYDDAGLTEGQESNLKLRQYEVPEWVDITKWLDTVNNIIYGETNHLSFFAVTHNSPPVIDAINAPSAPVQVNTTVEASASFSDPDEGDTHTSEWDWGDGASSAGTVDEASEIVSGSHVYTTAGVYTVTLTVTDEGNASGEAVFEYVVVYDASAGFVTGGGWIYSPEGAYIYDPSLTGKANFGFVSKYKKGASVPTGNTEFVFKAGDLNFHSSSYDWLVVTGSDYAKFKGAGTINGYGEYRFMLWAGDAPDTFRIKIWTEDDVGNETVEYDNGFDQDIMGGNIVIHAGK